MKASAEVSATRHTPIKLPVEVSSTGYLKDAEQDTLADLRYSGSTLEACAYISLAVNCHAELLEALNQAIAYMANPKGWDAEGLDADWRLLKAKAEGRSQ